MQYAKKETTRIINGKTAFTIVELLVVMAIIAVLISLLIPTIQKAMESAKRAQCAANLHQIGLGMSAYAINNSGWYPPYGYTAEGAGWWTDVIGANRWYKSRVGTVYDPPDFRVGIGYMLGGVGSGIKYIENFRVFYCPNQNKGMNETANVLWWNGEVGGAKAGSTYLMFNAFSAPSPTDMGAGHPTLFASKLTDKASRVLVADRSTWVGGQWAIDARSPSGVRYVNHAAGMNFLFNDGSVIFKSFPSVSSKSGFVTQGSASNYMVGPLQAQVVIQVK